MQVVEVGSDSLSCLLSSLDRLCIEIARKFNLYTSDGKPRKVFILDTLLRYSCRGCIVKVLSKQPRKRADALYIQNHNLAVSLLVEELYRKLRENGLSFVVKEEVKGSYGKPDVIVKVTTTGLILEVNGKIEVIVEVKSGESFSYAQIFRYLAEKPNAILTLWRVVKRQTLVFEGEKLHRLLLMVMRAALDRGNSILNGEYWECDHNPIVEEGKNHRNFQNFIDQFLSALTENTADTAEIIVNIIKRYMGQHLQAVKNAALKENRV